VIPDNSMSDHEFELYLSLLGRFLRLKSDQLAEIADELRDHLQSRLEELTRQGLSREQAVRRALDEFGDAASLAHHFAQITRNQRRRFIMRCTVGTTVAACVAVLVGMALLPGSPAINSPARAVADSPQEKAKTEAKDTRLAEVEQQLDSTTNAIDFIDTPLRDVLEFLSDTVKVDILPSRSAQIELDKAINLRLKHKPVSVRTALELVLEQLENPTSYTIRDGIVFITEQGQAYEMQVYNCRDLLESAAKRAPLAANASKPLVVAVTATGPQTAPGPEQTGDTPVKCAADAHGGLTAPTVSPAESLIRVITATVDANSWTSVGGPGSIEEFNGLLVVKQSQQAHRDVRKLLDMLRTTESSKP
jgi:hypothetical protein